MTALDRARPAATAAAALATLCAATTLVPLYDSARWVIPVVGTVAAMALTGAIARALRAPAPAQPIVQLAVLLTILTILFAQPAAAFGFLPGPVALEALQAFARESLVVADAAIAPVPTTPELVFLAVGGVGIVALTVDVIGVTLRLPALAGFPLLLLYAFPAAVVRGGVAWWLLPLAVIGWLVLLAVDTRADTRSWGPLLTARPRGPGRSPATRPARASGGGGAAALQVGVLAVLAALVVPALAPGLAEPVYISTAAGGPPGTGSGPITVDPFATLRRDLVDNPQREVLRYRTDGENRPYLRLVALENFDGVTWLAEPSPLPVPATDSIGVPDAPDVADVREVTSDIAITDLDNAHLPVPYAAARLAGIDGELDPGWVWDPFTRTVAGAGLSSQDTSYQVTSYQITPTREELRSATDAVDPEVEDLLALPADITPELERLAREVTADANSPYAKAMAMVRWFTQDGGFVYSTSVTTPEGADPLQSFLDDRVGYCQQFAGTMALMARAVGIPSRVVVGFTGGRDEGDERVVYARNAHAWPELWFEGIGWVWFEPTPRSDAGGGVAQPEYAEPRPETGDDAAGQNETEPNADRRIPPEEREGLGAVPQPMASGTAFPFWVVLVPLALLALLAAAPSIAIAWRRRRRFGAADPAARVEGAWLEVADEVRDLGWSWPLSATPRNAARGLARQVRLNEAELDALSRLATAVERARYAPPRAEAMAPSGADLRRDVRSVVQGVRRASTRGARVRATLMPGSLRRAGAPMTLVDAGWAAEEVVPTAGTTAGPRRGDDASGLRAYP
ncbi:MAG: hypothetical protein B7C55_08720 [Actinomycetales bacterium mxb001]|nr:MAG: hypothetical protein B7C55_08720 [Actinomycetales bacterium mxb001]